VPQGEWDACFPGDPEGWAYYRALEQSRLAAFSFVYFVARDAGRVVALAPAFVMHYELLTLVEAKPRALPAFLWHWLRRRLALRIVCLGSPLADRCHFGFAPHLSGSERRRIGARILAAADAFAAGHRIGLIAAKDVSGPDGDGDLGACFAAAGFARVAGLPTAALDLPGRSADDYLASLSHATRKDVRRKLRMRDLVKIEVRRGPEALELVPEIFRLYERQRGRVRIHFGEFERLTPEYFRAVLTELGKAAIVFVYWHQDQVIAFNLCLAGEGSFIDKFIGFRQPLARALNLYVLSWMTNVAFCGTHGVSRLQTGQTAYPMKVHLGSKLLPNWNYFRHRNSALQLALRASAPVFAPGRIDATSHRVHEVPS
jgi:hypothetical protein